MSGASIVGVVVGLIGACGSIAAVLVSLGRILAGLDSLREESRERGKTHDAKIEALRTDVSSITTTVTVDKGRIDALNTEVVNLRKTSHEHGNHIQVLLAKVS